MKTCGKQFENYVNYAGSKTLTNSFTIPSWFENYVNYAGSKTSTTYNLLISMFENYVNYAGSKTIPYFFRKEFSLRTM